MVDYIEDLYKIADLRNIILKLIRYMHANKKGEIEFQLKDCLYDEIRKSIEFIEEYNSLLSKQLNDNISAALKVMAFDVIMAADLLERDVLPCLEQVISDFASIDLDDECGHWRFLSTRSGYLSLKNIQRNRYIHSSYDPMEEARDLVQVFYKSEVTKYVILGCGLGYVPYELYRRSEEAADIVVFEKKQELIEYALMFGVLGKIPKERLKIYSHRNIADYTDYVKKNRGIHFMIPSMIMDEVDKDELTSISRDIMNQNTDINSSEKVIINSSKNKLISTENITSLKNIKKGGEIIVVGAGPSLDSQIEYIKEQQGLKTIVVVGTILRKVVKHGIRPDFVVIVDPYKRTELQINDVEDMDIPMIISPFVYWKITEKYKGKKYIMYAYGTMDKIESMAKEDGSPLFYAGGSVVSYAIETAVYLGAKKIELVGVDLSFPEGKSHTQGTIDYIENTDQGTEIVECTAGGYIKTSPILKAYISDVENQICHHTSVEFINLSRVGAKIKGTI